MAERWADFESMVVTPLEGDAKSKFNAKLGFYGGVLATLAMLNEMSRADLSTPAVNGVLAGLYDECRNFVDTCNSEQPK